MGRVEERREGRKRKIDIGRNGTSMCLYITVISVVFTPIYAAVSNSVSVTNHPEEFVNPKLTGYQEC